MFHHGTLKLLSLFEYFGFSLGTIMNSGGTRRETIKRGKSNYLAAFGVPLLSWQWPASVPHI